MMEISKKTIFIPIILILMLSAVSVSAESIWEGSAAMGRYGEFPFTGFYGASNSFQQNDFVEVENLENGKRTRLIVVDRLTEPGLLMLVSNEAAQELGIYQNDITRIKVRKLSSGQTPKSLEYDDLAYNPDPDLNPAAAFSSPDEMVYPDTDDSRTVTEPEPEVVMEPVVTEPEPEVVETVDTVEPEIEPAIAEAEPEVEPEVTEPAPEPEVVIEPEPEIVEQEIVTQPEPEVIEQDDRIIEPEPEIAVSEPDEGPLWQDIEPEKSEEGRFPVLSELPPTIDGLKDADVLISEEEIPADIAADSPEKPYNWPDTVEIAEPLPEDAPLYLTMDDLEEGRPLSETLSTGEIAHAAETDVLWPDGSKTPDVELAETPEAELLAQDGLDAANPLSDDPDITDREIELPENRLELISSGLTETAPVYSDTVDFSISMVPDVIETVTEEEKEYLTDISDYYSPADRAADVSVAGLPSPEPEIPEEVIAMLVGDHIEIAESMPETVDVNTAYSVSPELMLKDDAVLAVISDELKDAEPLLADDTVLVADILPVLPEGDNTTLVDVANGYISPEQPVFNGRIADYPDPNTETGDETVLVEAANGYITPESPEFIGEIADYPDPNAGVVPEEEAVLVEAANGYITPESADFSGEVADYPNPDAEPGEETVLVEAANGYITPEAADFSGEVSDYPNPDDAAEAADAAKPGDEVDYAEADEVVDDSTLPEVTELPEVAKRDEAGTEDLETAVPEYDENLEVSLVPAEVRPPEVIEGENVLVEGEPEAEEPLDKDIAEHSPEIEVTVVEAEPEEPEPEAVEIEVVVEPMEPEAETVELVEVEPEPPAVPQAELMPPAEVQMVSKLVQQKHYLQLGAFKEKNSAIKAAGSLVETYPVTILTDDAAAGVSYKLLLGPLSADESGVMLYNFRAGGYSDAFIRRIE